MAIGVPPADDDSVSVAAATAAAGTGGVAEADSGSFATGGENPAKALSLLMAAPVPEALLPYDRAVEADTGTDAVAVADSLFSAAGAPLVAPCEMIFADDNGIPIKSFSMDAYGARGGCVDKSSAVSIGTW
jgi:hypothetical protein